MCWWWGGCGGAGVLGVVLVGWGVMGVRVGGRRVVWGWGRVCRVVGVRWVGCGSCWVGGSLISGVSWRGGVVWLG